MPNPILIEAEIWTVARTEQGNAVLIRPKGSDIAVPIFIGTLETQSILIGFGGVEVPRPLTHDLLLSVLKAFGNSVDHIEIVDLKEETYFAKIIIGAKTGTKEFDARPSDALALAIRIKCPIFIAEHIVDEAGINVNLVVDGLNETTPPNEGLVVVNRFLEERLQLEHELESAIAEEDYEAAAEIRDRLKRLDDTKQG